MEFLTTKSPENFGTGRAALAIVEPSVVVVVPNEFGVEVTALSYSNM